MVFVLDEVVHTDRGSAVPRGVRTRPEHDVDMSVGTVSRLRYGPAGYQQIISLAFGTHI